VATSSSRTPSPGRSVLALAGFFVLCFGVAAIGAAMARHSIPTWYAGIAKPRFTPPSWTFAPVWVLLYVLMALAGWLVWLIPRREGPRGSLQYLEDSRGSLRMDALAVFLIQLALSGLWTPMFFQYHRLLVAVVILLALWCSILAAILLFWRVRPLAGALLLPSLAWASFATALNLVLLRLN